MRHKKEGVTASQKLRDFSRWASGTVLLPAFLTLNLALHAQDSSETSKLPQALALTSGEVAQTSDNFDLDVAATPDALTTSPSATLPKFIAHRDYLVGNSAVALALGDLNGDGIPDLIAPNSNTNNVGVLLGKANGSFQSVRLFDSGARGPFDPVVADFNADGKNDVAVTIPFSGGVSIMLGDGLGHLGTPAILAAATEPIHIVAADFNGDHRPDLAVTNVGSNNVSIFLGRGDGTFSSTVSPAVGVGPEGIVVGDFNADGKVDLAVANSGSLTGTNQGTNANTVAVLLGLGTGHFQPAIFIPVASAPLRLAVADFNKDTRQDIAVTNNGAGVVSLLLGNGTGTFQTPRTFTVANATNIGLADFNTDGNLDLVVLNGEFSTIALLLGNGTGSFNPAKQIPSGTLPGDVITGDVNRDGKADYITANGVNTVSVVLGRGNGTFVDIGSAVPTNGSTHSNQIIAADFNNDGITDLAQVNTGITPPSVTSFGTSVSILLGKTGGGFQAARVLAIGKNGPTSLAAADLNRDGALDLAVTTFGDSAQNSASLAILLGNGDGTFRAPQQFIPGPANPKSIAIADVNGDGKLDAIIAQDPTSLSVGGISLLLGDGNGNFGPQKTIVIGQPSNVVAADFNRDGKFDIAYLTDQNTVVVQLGNGNGTFQTPKVVTTSGFTTTFPTFGIGDFNNDGILDFAVEESGRVEVVLGDGQGSFTSKGKFLESAGSTSPFPFLMVADFNGDGVLDVAIAIAGFSQNVSLLLGNGDGTLRSGQLFGGAAITSAVAYPVAGFQPGIAMACQDAKVRIIQNTTP